VIPHAGVVVAVSEEVKRELIEHGIAPERIRVLHNGVDLDRFEPGPADRSALGLPNGVPLAVFVGDIQTPRKNLDSVLRALSDVPRLHLAVAGSVDGSPFPDLAARLGVTERTHFLGYRNDVADLMRAADLFAFPSRYEACSLVLLEAMASGLPIVTASTTGGAELVADEAGIVLDDPDDVDALACAFRRLADDPNQRASMGRRARRRAEDLSWATVGDRYLDLMRQEATDDATVGAV
jgi:glycosyltransferase involved in cell wall biosynthesis